jgi:hypothetical protein
MPIEKGLVLNPAHEPASLLRSCLWRVTVLCNDQTRAIEIKPVQKNEQPCAALMEGRYGNPTSGLATRSVSYRQQCGGLI